MAAAAIGAKSVRTLLLGFLASPSIVMRTLLD